MMAIANGLKNRTRENLSPFRRQILCKLRRCSREQSIFELEGRIIVERDASNSDNQFSFTICIEKDKTELRLCGELTAGPIC